jgi:hypothetical protein
MPELDQLREEIAAAGNALRAAKEVISFFESKQSIYLFLLLIILFPIWKFTRQLSEVDYY